jgi:hypothetical protein
MSRNLQRPSSVLTLALRAIACLAAVTTALPSSLYGQAVAPADAKSTLRDEDYRVAAVAYRLAIGGRGICPEPYPVTGLLLHHLPEYDVAGRRMEIERYGLDRGPGVLAVVTGSPAERSGLVAGDVLLTVNGRHFPDPRRMAAERSRKIWRRQVNASESLMEQELRRGSVRLNVLRAGKTLSLDLGSIDGCPARIRLARSTQLNAFANDGYVILTTKILALTRNDDELAIVIGHELAHIILHHAERLEEQDVPKGLLRSVGKNAERVRVTEEEADRLGLKLAWSAGYDVTRAADFWRRFYAGQGLDLQLFRTHPGLRARERALGEILAELGRENRPSAR